MPLATEYKKDLHYSREVERAVLGVCLLEKPPLRGVLATLTAEHFYDNNHQYIYSVLQEMHQKNLPVDLITVADYILRVKNKPTLGAYPAGAVLTGLTRDVCTGAHVSYHCAILKDMHTARTNIARSMRGLPPVQKKQRQRQIPIPVAKYLLKFIDKPIIAANTAKYGRELIPGKEKYAIRVDNANLVFMMHLIAPEYTWTTHGGDEYYSRDKIRTITPPNAVLKQYADGSRYWEDKNGYPAGW